MNLRCHVLLGAVAALLAPLVVSAQQARWDGSYVGVHVGGQTTTANVALVPGGYDTEFGPGSNPQARLSPGGFAGGVLAGYQWKVGERTYAGAEIDVTGSNAKDTQTTSATAGWEATNQLKQEFTGRARARLGYAAGNLLPFVAAGVSVTRINLQLDIDCYGQHYSDSESKTLTGYNLGAGFEAAVADKVRARLEYVFDDYGSPQVGTTKPDWNDRKFDNYRTSTVRLAVTYAF